MVIQDSPSKELIIQMDNVGTSPNNIIVDDYVLNSENGLYEYRTTVNTADSKELAFSYKVSDYYYSISQKVLVVDLPYSSLFNTLIPCILYKGGEFDIDLTLINSSTLIQQDNIKLNVEKEGRDIEFIRDEPSYVYMKDNINEYGTFNVNVYYNSDSLPFYITSFTLTSFNAKNTYNLHSDVFLIDFTDMKCDLGISSLSLRECCALFVLSD